MAEEIQEGDVIIALAGKEWSIPPLGIKQNRIVVPGLQRIFKRLRESKGEIDNATFDDIITVVYTALTRKYPALAPAEFQDMPIKTYQLVAALDPIAKQTGLFEPSPRKPPAAKAEKKLKSTTTTS